MEDTTIENISSILHESQRMNTLQSCHQEVKADYGKLQMMLMLPAINRAVVRVREYGILKYKDKDSWKKVSIERWENALIRHLMEYIKDPYSKDEESGLRHIDHIACNLAYILENMEGEGNDE